MEIVFIDPEPPGVSGGGIRTYLKLAKKVCHDQGFEVRIYTHNPLAYPGSNVYVIGRKSFLKWPWRGLAYRMQYAQNVLWEHAYWLNAELENIATPDKIYEFADFLGYGFFALRNKALLNKVILRVHTPNYLVPQHELNWPARLDSWLNARREKFALSSAKHITVPSAEFIKEKLSGLKNWTHIPNPLPLNSGFNYTRPSSRPLHFLYLGRIEPRKGVLPMVRCFLKFAFEEPAVTLTLVGAATPGKYCKSVRDLINSQSPDIRSRLAWNPPALPDELPELLNNFQVLVVPSLWENSPYVYFEGMAAGMICLGAATGEMKATAMITKGPLAKAGDEEDWLRALRTVTTTPCDSILAAQTEFLRIRRVAIPAVQIAFYKSVAQG